MQAELVVHQHSSNQKRQDQRGDPDAGASGPDPLDSEDGQEEHVRDDVGRVGTADRVVEKRIGQQHDRLDNEQGGGILVQSVDRRQQVVERLETVAQMIEGGPGG